MIRGLSDVINAPEFAEVIQGVISTTRLVETPLHQMLTDGAPSDLTKGLDNLRTTYENSILPYARTLNDKAMADKQPPLVRFYTATTMTAPDHAPTGVTQSIFPDTVIVDTFGGGAHAIELSFPEGSIEHLMYMAVQDVDALVHDLRLFLSLHDFPSILLKIIAPRDVIHPEQISYTGASLKMGIRTAIETVAQQTKQGAFDPLHTEVLTYMVGKWLEPLSKRYHSLDYVHMINIPNKYPSFFEIVHILRTEALTRAIQNMGSAIPEYSRLLKGKRSDVSRATIETHLIQTMNDAISTLHDFSEHSDFIRVAARTCLLGLPILNLVSGVSEALENHPFIMSMSRNINFLLSGLRYPEKILGLYPETPDTMLMKRALSHFEVAIAQSARLKRVSRSEIASHFEVKKTVNIRRDVSSIHIMYRRAIGRTRPHVTQYLPSIMGGGLLKPHSMEAVSERLAALVDPIFKFADTRTVFQMYASRIGEICYPLENLEEMSNRLHGSTDVDITDHRFRTIEAAFCPILTYDIDDTLLAFAATVMAERLVITTAHSVKINEEGFESLDKLKKYHVTFSAPAKDLPRLSIFDRIVYGGEVRTEDPLLFLASLPPTVKTGTPDYYQADTMPENMRQHYITKELYESELVHSLGDTTFIFLRLLTTGGKFRLPFSLKAHLHARAIDEPVYVGQRQHTEHVRRVFQALSLLPTIMMAYGSVREGMFGDIPHVAVNVHALHHWFIPMLQRLSNSPFIDLMAQDVVHQASNSAKLSPSEVRSLVLGVGDQHIRFFHQSQLILAIMSVLQLIDPAVGDIITSSIIDSGAFTEYLAQNVPEAADPTVNTTLFA